MDPSSVIRVHYGDQPPTGLPVLYFAGPTNFTNGDPNWHATGITILEELEFSGAVCLPTPEDGVWREEDAAGQTRWQFDLMAKPGTVTVFWVPRLAPMTYAEFGAACERYRFDQRQHPCILGLPPDVPRTGCLIDFAQEYGVPHVDTLKTTLDFAWMLVSS